MTGYQNPLSIEMERYLDLLEKIGRYVRGIKGLFREPEACIPCNVSKEEALFLKTEAMDFNQACLTIRKAKRRRQRPVPGGGCKKKSNILLDTILSYLTSIQFNKGVKRKHYPIGGNHEKHLRIAKMENPALLREKKYAPHLG